MIPTSSGSARSSKPILKLAAECQCWPLWLQQRPEESFENIDPETLALSPALKEALALWAAAFDKQYSLDDPYDALNGAPLDRRAFKEEGIRVYHLLCAEVGDRYSVTYKW